MRRMLTISLCLAGWLMVQMPSSVSAQINPPSWWTNLPPIILTNLPPDWTNQPSTWTNTPVTWTNLPPAWTNFLGGRTNRNSWGTNYWWTNHVTLTNRPVPPRLNPTNVHPVIHPGQNASTSLPKDVQTLVKQFQTQRQQLINSLATASDTERQQVLQQLESLRQQLQEQVAELRNEALDQAKTMKFGGHFGPINVPQESGDTGKGGKPR